MSVSVLNYRKLGAASQAITKTIAMNSDDDQEQPSVNIIKKTTILKQAGGRAFVIKKLPTTMKRHHTGSDTVTTVKNPKFTIQSVTSLGNLQAQKQDQNVAVVRNNSLLNTSSIVNNLVRGTPLKLATQGNANTTNISVPRPAIIIKRDGLTRTICTVTLELIEKNPMQHLGVHASRLPVLKNIICHTAKVQLVDCYLTLKKLRQNEDFALLAQYFEMTEAVAQQIFARSICRLARYLRFLIRWPDSKRFYERHKNMPFAFRSSLSKVQSMIECVDTEMQRMSQLECTNYKFIFSITPNGIISHISEAYVGHNDDLAIFKTTEFQASVPKFLTLFAVPGKGILRKRKSKSAKGRNNSVRSTGSNTDSADESMDDMQIVTVDENGMPVSTPPILSRFTAARIAGELASQQTLTVEDSLLTSRKVKDIAIPTMRVRDTVWRLQVCHMVERLREYKVLQPYAIHEPMVYQYLNEMLIVAAALTNLNS